MVEGERNRLLHVRLSREQSRFESGRQTHLPGGTFGREPGELDDVCRGNRFAGGRERFHSTGNNRRNQGALRKMVLSQFYMFNRNLEPGRCIIGGS